MAFDALDGVMLNRMNVTKKAKASSDAKGVIYGCGRSLTSCT